MVEEIFNGYEALGPRFADLPQSDTKRQKLLKCIPTRNNKLYLGKVYTEDQLAKLSEEEVENFLVITKLSSQARWCIR